MRSLSPASGGRKECSFPGIWNSCLSVIGRLSQLESTQEKVEFNPIQQIMC